MPPQKVLIIEDDDFVRDQMKWALAAQYEVFLAEDRLSALEILKKEHPGVVTLDLGLPPSAGDTTERFPHLAEMLQADPLAKVIVITGQDEQANALQRHRPGRLRLLLQAGRYRGAQGRDRRAHPSANSSARTASAEGRPGRVVRGHAREQPEDAGGLRRHPEGGAHGRPGAHLGESGTGKELAARAIHQLERAGNGPSSRSTAAPFPENCSKASCSATRRARSPAPTRSGRAGSRRRSRARCFWMRSAKSRRRSRSSSCASSRTT